MIVKHKITSPTIAKETCRVLYKQMQAIPFVEEVSIVCLKHAIKHIELHEAGVSQICKKTVRDLGFLWEMLEAESRHARKEREPIRGAARLMQANMVARIATYLKGIQK